MRLIAVVATAALATSLAACSGSDDDPPKPAEPTPTKVVSRPFPVALDGGDELPDGIRIGVVASLTSAPGEGSQWRASAEGAQVAAYRFRQAGADIELVAVDDRGTAAGAVRAVQGLVDDGVSGIVVASSGPHLDDALASAAVAGVPVLLPYAAADLATLPDVDVWLTGPDAVTESETVERALDTLGVDSPVLVDAGGPALIGTDDVVTFDSEQRAAALADDTADLVDDGADGIVVSGPASLQASAIRALQGAGIELPVVLSSDALSPVLAAGLVEDGGSLAADLVTVGVDTGDVSALQSTERGRGLAAYFAALGAVVGSDTLDFFDSQPFATVAADADPRSHDAVVALVRAVGAAGSTDPTEVGEALRSLSLGTDEGLVGPPLDFSETVAVAADDVVPLRATPQDPGVRPVAADPQAQLFWFPVPAS